MHPRSENLRVLQQLGFRVAPSLPVQAMQLRPAEEILARALALRAVCLWVAVDDHLVPSDHIRAGIRLHALQDALTEEDREILKLSRKAAQSEHIGTVGWRLENLWSLAWILGFDAQPALGGMIDDALIPELFQYFPKLDESTAPFLAADKVRPMAQVEALEDLFYCAHNAVRSAQLGRDTVPEGFDPVSDGGVVHERRHALTWAVSPGVPWDDTDLST